MKNMILASLFLLSLTASANGLSEVCNFDSLPVTRIAEEQITGSDFDLYHCDPYDAEDRAYAKAARKGYGRAECRILSREEHSLGTSCVTTLGCGRELPLSRREIRANACRAAELCRLRASTSTDPSAEQFLAIANRVWSTYQCRN